MAEELRLAQVVRLDESDLNVFSRAAEVGEWAIAGGFAFSNLTEAQLTGKLRQEFANGWLGLESFGRATLVAVTPITAAEYAALVERLAAHFVAEWGAPDLAAARPVAEEELAHMAELCAALAPGTLLSVSRSLEAAGVRERFAVITPEAAELAAFAVHGGPGVPVGGGEGEDGGTG